MRQGPMVFCTRSSTSDSSLARVSLTFRCFGPLASAVMYGRLTSVCWLEDSSILAFSAASFRRCNASGSRRTSTPDSFWNSSASEIDHALIEVLAAEEGIAVGREHLELALAVDFGNLDDGDVERTAAQVIDRDLAVRALLVEAVGQRRRGGLVDDALDVRGPRCGRRPWSPGAASR